VMSPRAIWMLDATPINALELHPTGRGLIAPQTSRTRLEQRIHHRQLDRKIGDGTAGLSRTQKYPAYGALHRAIAVAVQGFLAELSYFHAR
jgi:hypothetical protein